MQKLQPNSGEASGHQNRTCNLHGSTALRPLWNLGSVASRYRCYPNRQPPGNLPDRHKGWPGPGGRSSSSAEATKARNILSTLKPTQVTDHVIEPATNGDR